MFNLQFKYAVLFYFFKLNHEITENIGLVGLFWFYGISTIFIYIKFYFKQFSLA